MLAFGLCKYKYIIKSDNFEQILSGMITLLLFAPRKKKHVTSIILLFILSFGFSKNHEMTLEEFKWIWWMEYGHRMWGRLIGAYFYVPAAIFWLKGSFTPALKKRVVGMGILIAAQVILMFPSSP